MSGLSQITANKYSSLVNALLQTSLIFFKKIRVFSEKIIALKSLLHDAFACEFEGKSTLFVLQIN